MPLRQREQQQDQPHAENGGAEPVDAATGLGDAVRHDDGGHQKGSEGDAEGEPEHAVVVAAACRHQASQHESDTSAGAQRAADDRHRARHARRGQFVAHDADRQGEQPEGRALQHTGGDQQTQRGRRRGEQRAAGHGGKDREQDPLASEQIPEAPEQRREDRGGQQIGGNDPTDG